MSNPIPPHTSMSPTKRLTVTTFTIPSSASFLPLKLDAFPRSTSSESIPDKVKSDPFLGSQEQKDETELTSISHPVANFPDSNPNSPPDPISRPRSSSTSTWSPSLVRKLRWRLRRYTLWEASVFFAFIVASLVFFSALAGAGYIQEDPEPVQSTSGWRSPAAVLEHKGTPHISAADMLESFLRFSGLGRRIVLVVKGAEEDPLEEEEDAAVESMSRGTGHRVHERPRLGAWRESRHRMVTAHEPSAQLTPKNKKRRYRRAPWIEPPPPSPHHDSFHKRLSQLTASAESHGAEEGGGGEGVKRLDEDDLAKGVAGRAEKIKETEGMGIDSDSES